jgi:hypothetical protein
MSYVNALMGKEYKQLPKKQIHPKESEQIDSKQNESMKVEKTEKKTEKKSDENEWNVKRSKKFNKHKKQENGDFKPKPPSKKTKAMFMVQDHLIEKLLPPLTPPTKDFRGLLRKDMRSSLNWEKDFTKTYKLDYLPNDLVITYEGEEFKFEVDRFLENRKFIGKFRSVFQSKVAKANISIFKKKETFILKITNKRYQNSVENF